MKNNKIINAWNECLPNGKAKERMFDNIQQKYHHHNKRPKFAIIAATVVFGVILTTTVFAYGGEIMNVIQQFMFGNSIAAQVETIDGGDEMGIDDSGVIGSRWIIRNRSDFAEWKDMSGRYVYIETLDEAREITPFEIQEPEFIPDAILGDIHVIYFEDKTYGYDVYLKYAVGIEEYDLNLFQYYAGPDAYLEFTTIDPIQKIMVGDIEAFVEISDVYANLYWIKDEILFNLECGLYVYDLETLIKIAESVM
jgi:hypothetical protein